MLLHLTTLKQTLLTQVLSILSPTDPRHIEAFRVLVRRMRKENVMCVRNKKERIKMAKEMGKVSEVYGQVFVEVLGESQRSEEEEMIID